jgi:hypothetical protein
MFALAEVHLDYDAVKPGDNWHRLILLNCILVLQCSTSLLAFENQRLCDAHVPVVPCCTRSLGAYHRGNCYSNRLSLQRFLVIFIVRNQFCHQSINAAVFYFCQFVKPFEISTGDILVQHSHSSIIPLQDIPFVQNESVRIQFSCSVFRFIPSCVNPKTSLI